MLHCQITFKTGKKKPNLTNIFDCSIVYLLAKIDLYCSNYDKKNGIIMLYFVNIKQIIIAAILEDLKLLVG